MIPKWSQNNPKGIPRWSQNDFKSYTHNPKAIQTESQHDPKTWAGRVQRGKKTPVTFLKTLLSLIVFWPDTCLVVLTLLVQLTLSGGLGHTNLAAKKKFKLFFAHQIKNTSDIYDLVQVPPDPYQIKNTRGIFDLVALIWLVSSILDMSLSDASHFNATRSKILRIFFIW